MSQADISIWWDLESIKFENSFDPLWSYDAIKSSLERLGLVGNIVSVKAYAVNGVFSKKIITRLTKRPIEFVPVSIPVSLKVRKNSQLVDTQLSLDLSIWTKENKPPNVIVLMSCDQGYLEKLQGLKADGYETCIIYATGSCTSKEVENADMFKLKWVQEVLQTANPVDPKIWNLPYYGTDVNFKVSTPLISLHPLEDSVVVALGWDLRVFDISGSSPVTLLDESAGPSKESIRCIKYGATGNLFVSASDDKRVKIWCTKSWICLNTMNCKKGVSSLAITSDDSDICYADNNGDVHLVSLVGIKEERHNLIPTLLLHDSRIITTLDFSTDNRYIISADERYHINVTDYPKKDLKRALELPRLCTGHKGFITCTTFVSTYLISGSRDLTVKLWDISSGKLVAEVDAKTLTEAGDLESNKSEPPAVTDIKVIPNSSIVVVAIQREYIYLIGYDLSAKTPRLSIKKVICFEENFVPTSISVGCKHIWMVSGATNRPSLNRPGLARVMLGEILCSGYKRLQICSKALQKLQGEDDDVEDSIIMIAAEDAMNASMALLKKKNEKIKDRLLAPSIPSS